MIIRFGGRKSYRRDEGAGPCLTPPYLPLRPAGHAQWRPWGAAWQAPPPFFCPRVLFRQPRLAEQAPGGGAETGPLPIGAVPRGSLGTSRWLVSGRAGQKIVTFYWCRDTSVREGRRGFEQRAKLGGLPVSPRARELAGQAATLCRSSRGGGWGQEVAVAYTECGQGLAKQRVGLPEVVGAPGFQPFS